MAGGAEGLRVWDTASWEQLLTLEAPGSLFFSAAFSPDGNVLGASSFFGQLHLWRAPSWAEIAAVEEGGAGR
jgi:WD40 repeat protein